MQLYCKDGRVLAMHDDGQNVPASAYGDQVMVVPYTGTFDALARIGEPPPEGEPDTRPYAAPPIDLALVVKTLSERIDADAEAQRLKHLTPGSGQAQEYAAVQAEAAAALKGAVGAATPDKYPMLAASIGIDIDPKTGEPATDVLGVARLIDAVRARWSATGSEIRKTRLVAKRQIEEAGSVEEATRVYAGIVWPGDDTPDDQEGAAA